ncbi:DUF3087 family protein [Thalassotalea sediminis]|uniref:DUF3087 family protein n=1 Tax=Thalassotalea sediminis TaxID=1759089 RepID=UPI002572BE21|nr:DUF3087 family protein [Thalassotalea sediminis]
MQLQKIEKTLYRQRLNRIIIGFIVSLTLLSVLFGTLFISLFTDNNINVTLASDAEAPSNFRYNLAGVIFALFVCGGVLHRLRQTEYFSQVYYVWQLKQLQNKIYRRLARINQAAFDKGETEALIILDFYYQSLKQVYQLDDNTITMSTVNQEHQKVIEKESQKQVSFEQREFTEEMLNQFIQGEQP